MPKELKTQENSKALTAPKKRPGRPRGTAKNTSEKRTLVVAMDADLAEKMHIKCMQKDTTVSRELRRLVREFIEGLH